MPRRNILLVICAVVAFLMVGQAALPRACLAGVPSGYIIPTAVTNIPIFVPLVWVRFKTLLLPASLLLASRWWWNMSSTSWWWDASRPARALLRRVGRKRSAVAPAPSSAPAASASASAASSTLILGRSSPIVRRWWRIYCRWGWVEMWGCSRCRILGWRHGVPLCCT